MPADNDSRKSYKRYRSRRIPLPRRGADFEMGAGLDQGDGRGQTPRGREPDAREAAPRPASRHAGAQRDVVRGLDERADRRDRAAGGRNDYRASWDAADDRDRDGYGLAAGAAATPRRRRRSVWRRILLGFSLALLVVLIAFGVWAWLGWRAFDHAVGKANARITPATQAALTPDSGSIFSTPTTILVLGVDKRANDPGRSDTIMLVRSDPKTKSFSELSIARDMRVAIPGHGEGKINTGYFWGGPPLAIKTIEGFTGVSVNHIVIVSFGGFPRFIDDIGGINVYVPKTIKSWYSGGRTVTFTKGWHHFDGKTALIYSRIRYADYDFHRQARQQQVVNAMQKKLTGLSALPSLPWTGAKLMKTISTDLTSWELVQLAWRKERSSSASTHRYILAGTPAMIGGQSYIISDRAANLAKIHRFLND